MCGFIFDLRDEIAHSSGCGSPRPASSPLQDHHPHDMVTALGTSAVVVTEAGPLRAATLRRVSRVLGQAGDADGWREQGDWQAVPARRGPGDIARAARS